MQEKLSFAIEDIEFLEELNKAKFAKARVKVFSSGDNAHHKPISKETLTKFADTIYKVPLVWFYSQLRDDATTHVDGEVAVGFIDKDEANLELKEDVDGRLWLYVTVLIWKFYSGRFLEICKRDGNKSVSVEMWVFDKFIREDKKEEITSFAFTAITVLGRSMTPAIKDAKMEMLQFSKDKEEYESHKEGEKKLEFSLNSEQIIAIFDSALSQYKFKNGDFECKKYWVRSYDSEYVYVYDNEKDLYFRMKYQLNDTDATVDIESAEEVLNGGFILKVNKTEGVDFSKPDKNKIKEFCDGIKFADGDKEVNKYSLISYCDNYVYCYDCQNKKFVAMPYSYAEEKVEVKSDESKRAKFSCYAADDENEDEVYMALKTMFASDANTVATAQVAMNEKESEYNKKLTEEQNKTKMAEEKFATLEENYNKLLAEKVDSENKEKEKIVAFTINDVSEKMPKDKIEELQTESVNFTLENIDIWKNKVYAAAFDFIKDKNNEGIKRISLPFWSDGKKDEKSIWNKL